jgi:signal transduction histidine kinase
MTFQRKLLLGFSLMVLPVLLLGWEALRSNREERRALEALGGSMARTRTYAELETAMFNQSAEVWEFLTGMNPRARENFSLIEKVIEYWQGRWEAELAPDEMDLARDVEEVHARMASVSERIFDLYESGDREGAYRLAEQELKGRLLPELTRKNREIYGAARQRSVKRAFERLENILTEERRMLFLIVALSLGAGLVASALISRGLARPIQELQRAMAVVGQGRLDHPIQVRSKDEIGELARAFAHMTERLQRSHEALAGLNADLEGKIQKLEETQSQLVQSEKLASIGEMSAAVAHGLRNPLASLRAAAQVALYQMKETPAAREHLQTIIAEVDRLDRRISHLLSFSRPAPFRPARVQISQLVEGLLPAFSVQLGERRIALATDLPDDLPQVHVDPIQLEQALVEILSNGLDAMPGGGRLTIRGYHEHDASISADRSPEPGGGAERDFHESGPNAGRVVLELADTGSGISEQVLPSVFDPFFTTREEGTGLGLAIAKRYVEQNGGSLEIASVRGAGTTVRVRLPAAASSGQVAGPSAAAGAA